MKVDSAGSRRLTVHPGVPAPLGASISNGRANFAVHCTRDGPVSLHLFLDGPNKPAQELRMMRTSKTWHIAVDGIEPGVRYAFGVAGHVLMDPYSKALDTPREWRAESYWPFSVLVDEMDFDWQGCQSPRHADEDLVVYETHLRGFTRGLRGKVQHPGTYLGMVERLDALVDMGVTAVELLPVTEFLEGEYLPCNFWGYSPISFFVPMGRYAVAKDPLDPLIEFKTLVRECHRRGLELWLDIVFNHTGERDHTGPTLSYRGLAPDTYYLTTPDGHLVNDTGCGNTFACNHPISSELLMSALRWWVEEMHVDGFRFDLAAALLRGPGGHPMHPSPFMERIHNDPVLKQTRLIAEPWDAAGLHLTGHFESGSRRWWEWNDRFRDSVRRFWRGEAVADELATRLGGSQDMFAPERGPVHSLNFVTSHDGFSLRDLVSYDVKHNWENGEENRDGSDHNLSWNCGVEGVTDDAATNALRERQIRNFLITLFMARGTPMLTMGDEYGHTKDGNNNTWCHDNAWNWVNWEQRGSSDLVSFVTKLAALRREHPLLAGADYLTDSDVRWLDPHAQPHGWHNDRHFLGMHLVSVVQRNELYAVFHNAREGIELALPPGSWRCVLRSDELCMPKPVDERLLLPSHCAAVLQREDS